MFHLLKTRWWMFSYTEKKNRLANNFSPCRPVALLNVFEGSCRLNKSQNVIICRWHIAMCVTPTPQLLATFQSNKFCKYTNLGNVLANYSKRKVYSIKFINMAQPPLVFLKRSVHQNECIASLSFPQNFIFLKYK